MANQCIEEAWFMRLGNSWCYKSHISNQLLFVSFHVFLFAETNVV